MWRLSILILWGVLLSMPLLANDLSIALSDHSTAQNSYSEKRTDNFVLSKDTPISIGHGISNNLSTSTEPVDILSYRVHFHIPRNYLDTIIDNVRDRTVNFKLVTLYPTFTGVKSGAESGKLTDANKVWRWKFSPNLIYIDTIGGELGKKKDNDYITNVFKSEANEPDHPWKYGLLESTKSFEVGLQNIYFQRPEKTRPGIVIFCSKDTDVIQQCLIYARVSDDLLLRFQFHRELLPHWQEINQHLIKLVRSFIVKGA